MNWSVALLVSQAVGYAIGMAARAFPQVKNVLVPRIAAVATFITNAVLLWGEFMKASDMATNQVVSLAPWAFASDTSVAICGGFLSIITSVLLPGVISVAQTALNRIIWELGGKHIANSDPKKKDISKL